MSALKKTGALAAAFGVAAAACTAGAALVRCESRAVYHQTPENVGFQHVAFNVLRGGCHQQWENRCEVPDSPVPHDAGVVILLEPVTGAGDVDLDALSWVNDSFVEGWPESKAADRRSDGSEGHGVPFCLDGNIIHPSTGNGQTEIFRPADGRAGEQVTQKGEMVMGRKHTIWHRDRHMGVLDFARATDTAGLLQLHGQAQRLAVNKSANEKMQAKARKVLRRIERHLRERGHIPNSAGSMVGVLKEPANG